MSPPWDATATTPSNENLHKIGPSRARFSCRAVIFPLRCLNPLLLQAPQYRVPVYFHTPAGALKLPVRIGSFLTRSSCEMVGCDCHTLQISLKSACRMNARKHQQDARAVNVNFNDQQDAYATTPDRPQRRIPATRLESDFCYRLRVTGFYRPGRLSCVVPRFS